MRIFRNIILICMSLSIIPLILVTSIYFYHTQKELKTEIDGRLNAISTLKRNKLETFLNSRKEDLKALQGFPSVQVNLPTLEQFNYDRYSLAYSKAKWQLEDQLRAFMNSYAYADIVLLNTEGVGVFVTNPRHINSYLGKSFFNETMLQQARTGILYSGPQATKDWKYPYILYMVSEAVDTNGRFCGYIVLVLDMNVIYDFIADNTGLGQTGETFLLKKMPDGKFLYISPLAHDFRAILKKEIDLSSKLTQGIDYQGKESLSVIHGIDFLNWKIVTQIDKDEIFASINNIATVFFIVCVVILLAIVLGYLMSAGFILAPIEKLQSLSVHDPLTGALNRRGLQDVLAREFSVGQRMGTQTQVLLIDLDNFKQINDQYGHSVGDSVLVQVTQQTLKSVRQTDHVARIGGDEFMVILLDSRQVDAIKVAEKIRMAMAEVAQRTSSGHIVRTTCSIGMVPLEEKLVSIDALLESLHFSLRLSKTEGKNRITYQGKPVTVESNQSNAASEFKKIISSGDKFYTASQPIFDMRNMTKVGYELLSRLDHETYSSPDVFLLQARNLDLLGMVDYACMQNCLNTVKSGCNGKRIFINIFPSTLAETSVDQLMEDLNAAGNNLRFCLEINEQEILGDPMYLIPSVMRLKKEGVMIALDDYGFGHSSIETLVLLEPDIVKIDKKIIKDISKEPSKYNSLKRLLRVIESCKASVIAEGIETEEDLQVLRELGVVYGQGFFMGRPEIPPNLI